MNYDMQKKLQTAVIAGYATNIPVRITRATTAIAADTSTFLLTTEFVVVVVIVRDTNLNFRYNPCLPMARNLVTPYLNQSGTITLSNNMTSEILEIKTVFKGLQTLYDIHLPKADPALVHDLLIAGLGLAFNNKWSILYLYEYQ